MKSFSLIQIEHLPSKQRVAGLSPVGVAKFTTKEEAEAKRDAINLTAASNDLLYYDKLNALEAPIQKLKWRFIPKVLDHIDRSKGTRKNHFVTFNNIINWAIIKTLLLDTDKAL